jgi:signal transduction histidine kinase
VIFTTIDALRRKLTTERSAKYISDAANKIVKGDFEYRIELPSKFAIDESYLEIIDCFNKMAEELEGVETLRVDFISNVSHEMKTPLAVIKNYCKLLESDNLEPEKSKNT